MLSIKNNKCQVFLFIQLELDLYLGMKWHIQFANWGQVTISLGPA